MLIAYANVHPQGIYTRASIGALLKITKEIVIDVSIGTNNAEMLTFAVLTNFDWTIAAITYLFVEKDTLNGFVSPGATTHILGQSQRPLLKLGFKQIICL